MVLSRGLAVARLLNQANSLKSNIVKQSVRNSGGEWVYRTSQPINKRNLLFAEIAGGLMWWWIIYHLISEPGHIIGEFEYPDPSKWTDEELGIPPDDE